MNPQKTEGAPHNTERRIHTAHNAETTAIKCQTLTETRIQSEIITAATATSPKKANGFDLSHRSSHKAIAEESNLIFSPLIIRNEAKSTPLQVKPLF
jgi:hypothetical protein